MSLHGFENTVLVVKRQAIPSPLVTTEGLTYFCQSCCGIITQSQCFLIHFRISCHSPLIPYVTISEHNNNGHAMQGLTFALRC